VPAGPFTGRWVARLIVTSIEPEECRGWWTDEKELLDFQNEFVKFALYRLKY